MSPFWIPGSINGRRNIYSALIPLMLATVEREEQLRRLPSVAVIKISVPGLDHFKGLDFWLHDNHSCMTLSKFLKI